MALLNKREEAGSGNDFRFWIDWADEERFPSGLSDSFGVPGFGSAGPDLRSQGSSGKAMLSRCARRRLLIASNARSGRVPLPPVLPEVANRPPIISRSSPAKLETMIPSPPRLRAWMRVFHWRRFPPFLSP